MFAEKVTDSWTSQLSVLDKIVRPSVYYSFCLDEAVPSLRQVQNHILDFAISLLGYIVPVMQLGELFDGTVESHVSDRCFYSACFYQ